MRESIVLAVSSLLISAFMSGPSVCGEMSRRPNGSALIFTTTAHGRQRPSVSEVGAERRAASISGRVVTDSGQPLVSVVVHVSRVGPKKSVISVKTDEGGRFKAENLSGGAYRISVSAPGYLMPRQSPEAVEPLAYPGDSVNIALIKGGIITGKVTDARGRPVVAVNVRAVRVRTLDGMPARTLYALPERRTDDRGVYRLYGLEPGIYVVATGGAAQPGYSTDAYQHDVPTYHPSGSRDGAAEVRVESGIEVSGIDVSYRGEQGHAVSGSVNGIPSGGTIWLTLNYAGSVVTFATATSTTNSETRSFAFYGIPDGEYDLWVRGSHFASRSNSVAVQRIAVRAADVTGLKVSLTPLGSIAGRVKLEHRQDKAGKPECKTAAVETLPSIRLNARRDEKGSTTTLPAIAVQDEGSELSDEVGEFLLPSLLSGSYRLEAQLPVKELYVKSVTFGPGASSAAPKPTADAARNGLTVKPGEILEGVFILLSDGAASVQGRVPAKQNSSQPIRLHLVPAERESGDDVLRFAEAPVADDGFFNIKNLAPGKYWVLTRPALQPTDLAFIRPLAWDSAGRAILRREAEATTALIELQPCQQVTEYVVP